MKPRDGATWSVVGAEGRERGRGPEGRRGRSEWGEREGAG